MYSSDYENKSIHTPYSRIRDKIKSWLNRKIFQNPSVPGLDDSKESAGTIERLFDAA